MFFIINHHLNPVCQRLEGRMDNNCCIAQTRLPHHGYIGCTVLVQYTMIIFLSLQSGTRQPRRNRQIKAATLSWSLLPLSLTPAAHTALQQETVRLDIATATFIWLPCMLTDYCDPSVDAHPGAAVKMVSGKGTYILVLHLPQDSAFTVGKLGHYPLLAPLFRAAFLHSVPCVDHGAVSGWGGA